VPIGRASIPDWESTRLMSQLGTGKANPRKNAIYFTRSTTGGNILHNLRSYAFHLFISPFVCSYTPQSFAYVHAHCSFVAPCGFLAFVHPRVCVRMPSWSYAFAGSSFAPRPFRTHKRTPVVRTQCPRTSIWANEPSRFVGKVRTPSPR